MCGAKVIGKLSEPPPDDFTVSRMWNLLATPKVTPSPANINRNVANQFQSLIEAPNRKIQAQANAWAIAVSGEIRSSTIVNKTEARVATSKDREEVPLKILWTIRTKKRGHEYRKNV